MTDDTKTKAAPDGHMCRGAFALGTACGTCQRCVAELKRGGGDAYIVKNLNEHVAAIDKLLAMAHAGRLRVYIEGVQTGDESEEAGGLFIEVSRDFKITGEHVDTSGEPKS